MIDRITHLPRGTFSGATVQLVYAYYQEGYRKDSDLPELPCPPQNAEYVCPEEELYRKEVAALVKKIIDGCSPKTRKVLLFRFGIDCRDEHTLEEIAQIMDLTRERIRQIQISGLRRCRHPTFKLEEVVAPQDFYKTTVEKTKKEKNCIG